MVMEKGICSKKDFALKTVHAKVGLERMLMAELINSDCRGFEHEFWQILHYDNTSGSHNNIICCWTSLVCEHCCVKG